MSNTALTITEQQLEQGFAQKLSKPDMMNLHRAYIAGMKVLFDPSTHQQVLQAFENDLQKHPDTGGVIGADVAKLTLMLVSESKGTMPQQIIGPLSVLLLAKAFEFLNQAKVVPVNDAMFAQAVKVMAAGVTQGLSGQQNAAPQQPTQPAAPQQPTGILGA